MKLLTFNSPAAARILVGIMIEPNSIARLASALFELCYHLQHILDSPYTDFKLEFALAK
jgi:hypothetical protein